MNNKSEAQMISETVPGSWTGFRQLVLKQSYMTFRDLRELLQTYSFGLFVLQWLSHKSFLNVGSQISSFFWGVGGGYLLAVTLEV